MNLVKVYKYTFRKSRSVRQCSVANSRVVDVSFAIH